MDKNINERLEKLEKELDASKDEIKRIKRSFSFVIEKNIRRLAGRFTRKQLIVGFSLAILSISLIGIAGTVSKNYTFSDGEIVSAAKFNANFDTLYTLVNGNLDDNNISGISGSKITSGTVTAARIDNLSASIITSGTLSGDRLGSISDSKIYGNTIVFYPTKKIYTGNLGGRSGADTKCETAKKHWLLAKVKSNFRALISVSATDEIRDMVSNYSLPSSAPIISPFNSVIADNFSDLIDDNITTRIEKHFISIEKDAFTGSTQTGSITSNHCDGWTSTSNSATHSDFSRITKTFFDSSTSCSSKKEIICIAF